MSSPSTFKVKYRTRLAGTVAILALVLSSAACSSSKGAAESTQSADTSTPSAGQSQDVATDETDGGDLLGPVGFSESKLTDSFQVLLARGIEGNAEAAGINLLAAVDANADPAKQNTDISTLLSRGVTGIIAVPVDSTAIVPAIEQANEADVPVVTVDVPANGGQVYMTVHADNYYMGKAACEAMGDLIDGSGGSILNLQGDLASANGQDRSDGFTDCMAESFPNVEIISRPMEWSPEKCSEQAQTVLATTDVAGIYMGSEIICLGVVTKVLESLNKLQPVGTEGHIPMVGIDGSSDGLDSIRNDVLDALVSQPLSDYITYALKYMNDALSGVEVKEGPTDHGSEIVKEGDSYMDVLPSPIVTKSTVDDPSLWGNG